MTEIRQAAERGKQAAARVARLDSATKDAVLRALADLVEHESDALLAANLADVEAAREAGLTDAKLRRLALDEAGLSQMATAIRQIAEMPDPVGRVSRAWDVPSGLRVERVRTPLGVVAMIYEARPGVTIDAFSLCFKAGNACILKGGREAARSNEALAALARRALEQHGAPADALTLITTSDRDEIRTLLSLSDLIDLVIPRGGESLIRFVHEHSRIPTVQHFRGVCHIFVDASADIDQAVDICATAKTGAPATCNAVECVLVHQDAAGAFIPKFAARCAAEGVELRADDRFRSLPGGASVTPAADADFGVEFLDLVLAAKVVGSIDDAIAHIARHGSDHTESILTRDDRNAERFCREVTSSCVLVNASTRFNDGFQLGLGAEIGISTSRVHWYGPMGLEGLTTERFVVRGSGQRR